MNDNSQEVGLKSLRTALEGLTATQLKRKAETSFGIKLASTADKASIIDTIVGHAQKFNFSAVSDGELKPGYARIKLHPIQGRPNTPHFVGVNDRSWFVPINVEVDVPIKILRALENAIELKPTQDIELTQTIWDEQESQPFSIIQIKDGPDPAPGFEVAREAKLKNKLAFVADMAEQHGGNGWWPKNQEVKEWLEHRSRNPPTQKKVTKE